jgi:hypothetical protein
MINAYVIRIKDNKQSSRAADRLILSMPPILKPVIFDAIVPDQVDRLMKKYNLA